MWNLLESAGVTRDHLRRRYDGRVGVYVGSMYQQYRDLGGGASSESIASVTSYSSIANRVSHFFGLTGPSVAVDTMCSSAAVAIHMACKDLLGGDCQLAIAGGVNLSIHPHKYLGLGQMEILGTSAGSRAFAASDGYLPAEAVGAVLLKPLARAIEDGDPILAVIKSTAVNHGGRSAGYAMPSLPAQIQVMEAAIASAGVDRGTISYVEAAANGSPAGDAVELNALARVFGQGGGPGRRRTGERQRKAGIGKPKGMANTQ